MSKFNWNELKALELKPCKYCGGEPKLVRVGDQKEFFSFMCSSCFKHHAHYDEARVTPLGAARVWNRRADND